MIDEIDRQLRQWIGRMVGGATITLGPPCAEQAGVTLYLLDLLPSPPPRTGQLAPHQFTARYLVSTWDANPEVAHKLLGDLAFAALEQTVAKPGETALGELALDGLDVEFQPVATDLWTAFGVAPRPTFFLRLLVRKARIAVAAPPVTQPLVVAATPTQSLVGKVQTPYGLPVSGAHIEAPALGLTTQSDNQGRFRFGTLPAGVVTQLVVKAKGHTLTVTVEHQTTADKPLVIEFDPLSDGKGVT